MFLIFQVFNTYLLAFISETFMIFLLVLVLVNYWVIAHTNSTHIYSLIKKIHYSIFPYTIIFPQFTFDHKRSSCVCCGPVNAFEQAERDTRVFQ